MDTSNEWISQVTSWRFEQAWPKGTVAALRLPIANENSTSTRVRQEAIHGNEPEGPSFERVEGNDSDGKKGAQDDVVLTLHRPTKDTDRATKKQSPAVAAALPPKNSGDITPQPTVPASCVRDRQVRHLRDTKVDIAWFSSASEYPIERPPELLRDSKLAVNDIYVHSWRTSHQAWRCSAITPVVWVPLTAGETLMWPGDDKLRQFVITEGGKPSFVVPPSYARRYKDKGESGARGTN